MADLQVFPARRPLRGSVPVVGDTSITHRVLLLAAIADGRSLIKVGGSIGHEAQVTAQALRQLGVSVVDSAPGEWVVSGVGLHGLSAPGEPIDCGSSATTMRLLAGLLAAQPFASTLTGSLSLSRRPMERLARPLRLRGARIEGQLDPKRVGEVTAPLQIGPLPPPHVLSGLEYELPLPSAQVKGALLLSGLYSEEPTWVRESTLSRDHTERLLSALGVPMMTAGGMTVLDAPSFSGKLPPFEVGVPGDLSAAAFVAAAALLVPGSELEVRGVGLNPTRSGLLEVLRDMGATFEAVVTADVLGEPLGALRVLGAQELLPARVGGEVVVRAMDEVPVIVALAARARGVTVVRDASELRVKKSDRLAVMTRVLRAFGVEVEEHPDGLVVEGSPDGQLRAADVSSEGDPRVAMSAALLGLVADGPSTVRDADCIAASFPKFVGTLRALGAELGVRARGDAFATGEGA